MKKRRTLMRAIAKVRRAWKSYVRELTLAEGIPDAYRTVLLFLVWHPGANQRNIAEFADITTSAINQAVKNMLEEGYLRKEVDSSDKRNTKLYLTEKGANVAEKLLQKMDTSDDAITAMVGKEREDELIAFLEQLADFIRKDLS